MTESTTERLEYARGRVLGLIAGQRDQFDVGNAELQTLLTKIEMALWPIATEADRERALLAVEAHMQRYNDLIEVAFLKTTEAPSDARH
ncbi:MAG: hypothetical protein ABL908_10855 [Hyphomicrobium sp.]